MKSLKHGNAVILLLSLLMAVTANPNCVNIEKDEVVCTAGDSDFILRRGLVSDNNVTTKITLSQCRITEVDYEAFENDYYLKYIDLSFNKITNLKLGVLDGNTQVTHLNLSHNLLTGLPLGLFDQKINLEVLDLKDNKIDCIDLALFDNQPKLAHLDLSGNPLLGENINVYTFDQSTKIKFIDFSRNNMSASDEQLLQAFLELDFLNLVECYLKEVPLFATRPNLKTMKQLMLSANLINKIDKRDTFVNLGNLEILHLNDNFIEVIEVDVFKPLKKLKVIVLKNNLLMAVPDGLFLNIISLENVDMSHNLIESAPVNAFRGTSIKDLNLSYNRFSYLDGNFCLELRNTGVRLNKFYFHENPWQCACLNEVLIEMKLYNVEYYSVTYNGEYAVCVTTKLFSCKRHINELFVELYDNRFHGKY